MASAVIFVDAGYVYAAGSDLVAGEPVKREWLALKAQEFVDLVFSVAAEQLELPDLRMLRTYWYDGARDGIPTDEQRAISSLPRVKLRLGRVAGGQQKGVDGLIILDLITLAQNRAVDVAVIVSGDEDLREAARYAQSHGVTLCLVGFPPTKRQRQSDALIRESDYHLLFTGTQFSNLLTVQKGAEQAALDLGEVEAEIAITAEPASDVDAEAALDTLLLGILKDDRFADGVTDPKKPGLIRRGVDRVLVARLAEETGVFPVEADVLQRARRRLLELDAAEPHNEPA